MPVIRIPVPNPFTEGANSVYAILPTPVTLIDTGMATDEAYQTLLTGLAAHGLRPADVGRVILTHKHIDHIGNAWRIQRESRVQILIHESERSYVMDVDPSGERFAGVAAQRLQAWHVPESAWPKNPDPITPRWRLEPAEADGLVDGQRIQLADGCLKVIHTPGHTMGSICLQYDSYLFVGDHILPDISPNVGGGDLRHRDMLRHYLASLERIEAQAQGLKAMPGHGEPFAPLGSRCRELVEHHQQRLDQIRNVLRCGPLTIYELACRLFGPMEHWHLLLGCAEANAHIELLVEQGEVACEQGKCQLVLDAGSIEDSP